MHSLSFVASIQCRAAFAGAFSILLATCGATNAGELTGVWSGTVTASDGRSERTILTFNDADCLIMSYYDQRGQKRSAELCEAGQTLQYVPRGGGVKTHVVQSLDHTSDSLSFVLATTFEHAQNGNLQQDSVVETYEFTLGADGLNMRLAAVSANRFGDADLTAAGENERVSEGVLQKQ